jgi:endonuclease/exonuclease/phosphatase family metal-dependent hydrolase
VLAIAAAVAVVVIATGVGVGLLIGTSTGTSSTGTPAGGSTGTSADGSIRLLQFNMCGHVCRDSSRDKALGVADFLAAFHPAAASLNEVCRSQLTAVVAAAADRGWAMHARFIVTQPDECSGSDDYGNAVLTRSPIRRVDALTYAAQDPGNPEHRGLLCVTADLAGRPTHVCTTHIVDATDNPDGTVRRAQIALAARRVGTYRGPVVLMGDFNARPTATVLSPLYSRQHGGGGYGDFDEVAQGPGTCRCGERTHDSGAKYDYIFVTRQDFGVVDAVVARSRFSDHRALEARVTPRR